MENLRNSNPLVMAEHFQNMQVTPELFVIRRLDTPHVRKEHNFPSIRSAVHGFFFVTQGETLIVIGDEPHLFKANECAVIPAGQLFSVRYYNNCQGFMGSFHTGFLNTDHEGNNLLRTFGFLRKWGTHKVSFDAQTGQYITHLFERLYAENEQDKNRNIIKVYLSALLVEIDAAYRKMLTLPEDIHNENSLCNQFLEWIFDRPDLNPNIAYYAEKLNVTQAHLQKLVKRCTGKTPLAWINEAIVLEAKALLSHSEMPVSEIARAVGVLDPSYFARFFKKQTGQTPQAFRKETAVANY